MPEKPPVLIMLDDEPPFAEDDTVSRKDHVIFLQNRLHSFREVLGTPYFGVDGNEPPDESPKQASKALPLVQAQAIDLITNPDSRAGNAYDAFGVLLRNEEISHAVKAKLITGLFMRDLKHENHENRQLALEFFKTNTQTLWREIVQMEEVHRHSVIHLLTQQLEELPLVQDVPSQENPPALLALHIIYDLAWEPEFYVPPGMIKNIQQIWFGETQVPNKELANTIPLVAENVELASRNTLIAVLLRTAIADRVPPETWFTTITQMAKHAISEYAKDRLERLLELLTHDILQAHEKCIIPLKKTPEVRDTVLTLQRYWKRQLYDRETTRPFLSPKTLLLLAFPPKPAPGSSVLYERKPGNTGKLDSIKLPA